MNSSKELGQFPKAGRVELSPSTVGLHESDRPRRVAGLPRDEGAMLAAISTDYGTRLERGRTTPPRPCCPSSSGSCT